MNKELFKSNTKGQNNSNELFKVPQSVEIITEKADDMITKFSDGNLVTRFTNLQDFKVFKKGQKRIISELVDHHIAQIHEINVFSQQILTNSIQNGLVLAKTESRQSRALNFVSTKKQLLVDINVLTRDFLNFVQVRKSEIISMEEDEYQRLAAEDLGIQVKTWFTDNKILLTSFSEILTEYKPQD